MPPFGPLHAHVAIAHVGDDIEGMHHWAVKNLACDKPGMYDGVELDQLALPLHPDRHSSGRFHDVWDPVNKHWGNCPPQETSSFMIDTLVNIMAGS